jgi:glyoxylate/hydroxypyruvate reductase A
MDIIFYSAYDNASRWLERFERLLPDARIRAWQPGDDAHADYAVVWRPAPDMLRGRTALRAIFNLGAGVDALLEFDRTDPGALPVTVPLVRLEDTGMAAQMTEYATYATLRYMRRFDEYERLQARGEWRQLEPFARDTFTVAVLGLGALGAHVAHGLVNLGVPVRGFARTPKQIDGVDTFSGPDGLARCLDGAHVLVNLLPHTDATRGILNRATFARLAQGAYVVNVARGPHLVDQDLLDALASGQIAGAMLDVFHAEPLPHDHPFRREPRITITPHVSALTLPDESAAQIAAKIRTLEHGGSVSGVVDRAVGY